MPNTDFSRFALNGELITPQCLSCKHFNGVAEYTCAAFKYGIPPDIYDNTLDHTKAVAGDNGIRYLKRMV